MIEERLDIKNMIYEIRGKQVMLDSDLARLYQVETKRINEAVKRNQEKFPERFSWQLSDEESKSLLVAICDQKTILETRGGKYNKPRVFTEQGVAMLATILKSKVAVKVSINIMDAFVEMRKYISNSLIEQKYINNLVLEHDTNIKLLMSIFDTFKEKTNNIYFPGRVFDAYSKILDIFLLAKNNITIIDSYADKSLLDMISKIKVNICLICNNSNRISKLDIDKYNMQYHNLKVIRNNTFHDRYFIIDNKIIYHLGTSINNAGDKIFSINILEDKIVKTSLLNYIGLI